MSRPTRRPKAIEDYEPVNPPASSGGGPMEGEAMEGEVIEPSSPRSRFAASPTRRLSDAETDALRRAAGASVVDDPAKLAMLVSTMDAVREQTIRGFKASIQVGRDLNALKAVLTFPEWIHIRQSSRDIFSNWSSGNITKVMAAAEFVARGWVSGDLLPSSYTVLYQLSQLNRRQVQTALELQLIRPSIRRSDVLEITQNLLAEGVVAPEQAPCQDQPPPALARLDAEIAEARSALRRLLRQRNLLTAKLRRTAAS